VRADDDAGAGRGQPRRKAQLAGVRAGLPFGPQCMNTMTTLARFRAARTAASVRRTLIAFASPDRVRVATQDEASSVTWGTTRTAILTPWIVVMYGAQAARAFLPMPTYGKRAWRAAAIVSCRPVRP